MKTLSLDLRSAEMLTKSELRQVKGGKTCLCMTQSSVQGYLGGVEDKENCTEACAEAFQTELSQTVGKEMAN